MAQAAVIAVNELTRMLRAEDGLNAAVTAISSDLASLCETDIVNNYAAADLLEKLTTVRYPSLHVYCDRVTNKLGEKFRTFSGTVQLAVDVRVTHEHIDQLHDQVNGYVQAVTDVLDRNRGTWAPGVFHAGTYEITFQPAKRGGKNFIQTARVSVEAHVSVD
jgi:hypothetical protein